eukprot:scaffold42870_cov60-Phaeocystis_antarctica.AAC.1
MRGRAGAAPGAALAACGACTVRCGVVRCGAVGCARGGRNGWGWGAQSATVEGLAASPHVLRGCC